MSAPREEVVPALPLTRRRRTLGYVVPLLNLPLSALQAYQTYVHLMSGVPVASLEFLNDVFLLAVTLSLGIILPWWAPVYPSSYRLTRKGVVISRFLRGSVTLPYRSIMRAEVYVRRQPAGEVSKEAVSFARESVEALRRSGFKLSDYTNAEDAIVLLLTERRIYMLSPEKPQSFIKRLRRRVPKLPVRLVELTARGKRVREI